MSKELEDAIKIFKEIALRNNFRFTLNLTPVSVADHARSKTTEELSLLDFGLWHDRLEAESIKYFILKERKKQ